MPIDYKNYPDNWKSEIRPAILARAENRCECCGVENYAQNPVTGSKVVLTIAHLDHNTTNNSPENLRALCQLCHLRYDSRRHVATRRRKAFEAQPSLF